MRTIGIAAKTTSHKALAYAQEVGDGLRARGYDVIYAEDMAQELGITNGTAPKATLGRNSDLLVTFGGDGTLLSVARHAPEHVPTARDTQ